MEIRTNSIRGEIMEMFKTKFGGFSFWSNIESNIALKCADLSEPNNKESSKEFVKQLKVIKSYILEQDVQELDLKFLDDEIQLHEQTRIISLYEEKEDFRD